MYYFCFTACRGNESPLTKGDLARDDLTDLGTVRQLKFNLKNRQGPSPPSAGRRNADFMCWHSLSDAHVRISCLLRRLFVLLIYLLKTESHCLADGNRKLGVLLPASQMLRFIKCAPFCLVPLKLFWGGLKLYSVFHFVSAQHLFILSQNFYLLKLLRSGH